MTAYLFLAWLTHFSRHVRRLHGLSTENKHLLILDGHGLHVTLEVVKKATMEGIDIITLPSHTSHRLQPLDVSIFKSFKAGFRASRDRWIVDNKGTAARKEELAQWVASGLRKALTPEKIKKGFVATGIWPLQSSTMNNYMGPSLCYSQRLMEHSSDDDDEVEEATATSEATDQSTLQQTESHEEEGMQYFVPTEHDSDHPMDDSTDSEVEEASASTQRNLFPLPQVPLPTRRNSTTQEPLIDYRNSILMTSEEYISAVQAKAAKKAAVAQEREQRKKDAADRKAQR